MFDGNQTTVNEFIFMGFQNLQSFNPVLFVFFFTIYMLTLVWNLLIVVAVVNVPTLKSPMYFFISQLSLSDILLSTNVVPNLLHITINGRSTITVSACITQFYFCGSSVVSENLLLTVMSYDRYLAICKPLHYIFVMNLKFQLILVLLCWCSTCLVMTYLVCLISNLRFCGPHIIDHYFCDLAPIVELSCSDRTIVDLSEFTIATLFAMIPLCFILTSYTSIFVAISKISSSTGKLKSFSTCSSHLIVVSMYYGSLITIYMVPSKGQSYNFNKVISLLYTMGIPFFNPIIYSLRNQDLKTAVKYMYNIKARY